MALTTDKFILPNGAPSGGNQPMQSSTWGEVSGKIDNGIVNYTNVDAVDGDVLTTDGAGNLTLQPIPSSGSFLTSAQTNSQTPPPSDQRIQWNNATQTSSTKLFIDYTTSEGVNIPEFMQAFIVEGSRIIIQRRNDQSQFQIWDVTASVDQGTYLEVDVTFDQDAGAAFSNNANLIVYITEGTSQSASASTFISSLAETGTQAAPPADKFIIWNNATQNTSTKLFISHTDTFGILHQQLLETINEVGARLLIHKKTEPDIFQAWVITIITLQTGYTELDVTLLKDNGGNFADDDVLSILLLPPQPEVFHDSSLTGLGTFASPLSVVGAGSISKMIAHAEDVIENITISTQSVYEEIDTTTLALIDDGDSNDFTVTNGNRLRYDGTPTKVFIATLNFSGEKTAGGGGIECNFSLFKNGSIQLAGQSGQVILNSQRSNCQTFQKVSLATNDYIVGKVKNNSSDDNIQLDDISIYITEF